MFIIHAFCKNSNWREMFALRQMKCNPRAGRFDGGGWRARPQAIVRGRIRARAGEYDGNERTRSDRHAKPLGPKPSMMMSFLSAPMRRSGKSLLRGFAPANMCAEGQRAPAGSLGHT